MQKNSDYLVRNQKLIAEYLTDIFKHKCIITAHFGENNASFLTAILELDVKNSIIKVDCAPAEHLNQQLLNSAKVLFRTQIDGIKVSFSGKSIKKTKIGDHHAFEMPLPDAIFWMQRRQFYRVKIPLSHTGSFCEIAFQDESEHEFPSIRTEKFRLNDIGINGFAFLNPHPYLNQQFQYDIAFNGAKLFLHEGPNSVVGFVIKDVTEIKVNTTSTQQRIGCQFSDITPSFESGIQRYMQDIERQMKNIG